MARCAVGEDLFGGDDRISDAEPTPNGNLIHFGTFKRHIEFYPVLRGVVGFKNALSAYEGDKGTAKFPLDKPMPLDSIRRIIKYRAKKIFEGIVAEGEKSESWKLFRGR